MVDYLKIPGEAARGKRSDKATETGRRDATGTFRNSTES